MSNNIKKKSAPTFISKYKPYHIDDFHLDTNFKQVLQTLFVMDDLNLLLIGAPNSGKTSFLYAMIREYYNLKRDDSISESNILFINNLKEQGIQFFRTEMKTFCRSHCGIYGKKKLIIIDDMDMINEQSQQVFRNYIDKYKHNVNFIAVCSNIQKIIESIQSRVNILQIPTLSETQINDIMENIVKKESIFIDNESKEYLLKISGRSIRNVINNLEKIFIVQSNVINTGEQINIEKCKKICSNISFLHFEVYLDTLFSNNLECLPEQDSKMIEGHQKSLNKAIQIIQGIFEYGYSVIDILDYFFTFVKSTQKLSEDQKYKIIPILCKYITIFHNIHEDSIELALFTNEIYENIHNSNHIVIDT
jgi:DNA polymerase III delta prime subunit